MRDEDPPGPLDGSRDGLQVEGPQRPQVYDLRARPFGAERLGCFETEGEQRTVRDDRQVLALHPYGGLPDGRQQLLRRKHGLGAPVEGLVLQEKDRVIVADGGLEQPLCVLDRPGRDDLQSGRGEKEALRVLRVEQPAVDAGPGRQPDHHGDARAPAVAIAEGGSGVDDLIEAAGDEVGELHLRDGAKPEDGRSDGSADDERLGDRCVDDSGGAVFLEKTTRRAEGPAEPSDILSEDEHGRVPFHLLVEGLADRIEVAHGLGRGRLRGGRQPGQLPRQGACSAAMAFRFRASRRSRCADASASRDRLHRAPPCLRVRPFQHACVYRDPRGERRALVEDVPQGLFSGRERAGFSKSYGAVDLLLDLQLDLGGEGGDVLAAILQVQLEELDRVPPRPLRQLVLGTVPGRIVLGMAVMAIGQALNEGGAFALPGAVDRRLGHVQHAVEVLPVAADPAHAIGGRSLRHRLHGHLEAHGGRVGVEVVLADEDDREVMDAGEIERFVEISPGRCPLSEEGDGDARLVEHLEAQRCPDRDGERGAEHAGGSDDAAFQVSGMKEAVAPAGKPVAPPHELGDQDSRIDPAREENTEVAVEREDDVRFIEEVAEANRDRFLPLSRVNPAQDLVLAVQRRDGPVEEPDPPELTVELDVSPRALFQDRFRLPHAR